MSSREIKVTDKRLFNAEGELREEYRFLDDAQSPPPEAPTEAPPPQADPAPPAAASPPPSEAPSPEIELPEVPGQPAPTFFDLVAMLAEPAAIYLGDMMLPDGRRSEDLPMARLHIDLLAVLAEKSAGALTPEEGAFLRDTLSQLRLRYVQKRG